MIELRMVLLPIQLLLLLAMCHYNARAPVPKVLVAVDHEIDNQIEGPLITYLQVFPRSVTRDRHLIELRMAQPIHSLLLLEMCLQCNCWKCVCNARAPLQVWISTDPELDNQIEDPLMALPLQVQDIALDPIASAWDARAASR